MPVAQKTKRPGVDSRAPVGTGFRLSRLELVAPPAGPKLPYPALEQSRRDSYTINGLNSTLLGMMLWFRGGKLLRARSRVAAVGMMWRARDDTALPEDSRQGGTGDWKWHGPAARPVRPVKRGMSTAEGPIPCKPWSSAACRSGPQPEGIRVSAALRSTAGRSGPRLRRRTQRNIAVSSR